MPDPIIDPAEYRALKAAGSIALTRGSPGKIDIAIDRGEFESDSETTLLAWLAAERQALVDAIAVLDEIKTDIENVP